MAKNEPNWVVISAPVSGSATKARVYISTFYGACDVKFALYDNAGTSLLANGVATASGGNAYLEITFGTPVSVTSGTSYRLAYMASTDIDGRYLSGEGELHVASSGTYAGFPPASLPSDIGPFTRRWVVGFYIVP